MTDSTPRDAVRIIRSQLRRVRWRRNLFELQRALYLLIATAAAGAAATVLLALRAETVGFAVAAAAIALAGLLLAAVIATGTRRRWLGAARASHWIDQQAGLQGRLSTVIEVAARRGAEPALLPLLFDENRRRLPAWAPETLLPESFPGAALGIAVAATTALFLVLLFGDRLIPPPEIAVSSDGPRPERLTRVDGRLASRREIVPAADGDERDEPSSVLARETRALQERIRRQLWGRGWQAAAAAMARSEEREQLAPPSTADGGDAERSWQIARPASSRGHARPTQGETTAGHAADGHDRDRASPANRADGESGAPGDSAPGAGSGTDPSLFGAVTGTGDGDARFELPIAARVHAVGGGPRPPAGDAPPAAPDRRPDLAARQRRDAPVLRTEVPAAYEAIVRHVFAHSEVVRP